MPVLCNTFAFSLPYCSPGRRSDFSHYGVGERNGMYCSALFPFPLGTRLCFSLPGVLQARSSCGKGCGEQMLLLLGGQVWLILDSNTEKPSVVTYLNHILQNHFDQNLRWFLYYLSLLHLSSFKIHLHGDNYSHYHVIKTPAVLKSLCFKYKNWFWYCHLFNFSNTRWILS